MRLAFAIFVIPFAALFGMSRFVTGDKPAEGVKEEIRIMPVARSPESNTVALRITRPKENETLSSNPVWAQFRIEGFALDADSSQFQRSNQIAQTSMGQTVHVIVDNEPYFPVNNPAIDPFNEAGYFYYKNYKFELPFTLKEGPHTLRMFPARAFGESLKEDNTFATCIFYMGNANAGQKVDLSKPYLTYNEPSDQMELTTEQPVLLDFLISNCELTPDGYTVRLTVDQTVRTLSSWQPYYIYGLTKGKHRIRLELMNEKKRVPGPFNDVTRTITIQ